MASRFVSAGAIDPATGEATSAKTADEGRPAADPKDDEWAIVQRELEAERRRREEQKASAAAGGEKSLYEVLEANKAAKQAAFEEANKIKNQFRPLDDDEIEFLDDVAARRRAEEDRVRRETEEGLRAFRAAQGGGVKPAEEEGEDDVEGGTEWGGGGAGRKRKRDGKGREHKGVRGIIRRKTSEGKGAEKEEEKRNTAQERKVSGSVRPEEKVAVEAGPKAPVDEPKVSTSPVAAASKPKLGLVDYGSDDDDD